MMDQNQIKETEFDVQPTPMDRLPSQPSPKNGRLLTKSKSFSPTTEVSMHSFCGSTQLNRINSGNCLAVPQFSYSDCPSPTPTPFKNKQKMNDQLLVSKRIQAFELIDNVRQRSLNRAKLKQSAEISALLSGFALVALVEMDIDPSGQIPLPLLIFFIVTITLLVSVHMIALMISTCILPHIESGRKSEERAADIEDHHKLQQLSAHYRTPTEKLHRYITISWYCSTVIGIFLFILELGAVVWVKFWNFGNSNYQNNNNNNQPSLANNATVVTPINKLNDGKIVALVSTCLLFPVLIALTLFACHFYRKLVMLHCEQSEKKLTELNEMVVNLQ